MAKSVRQSGTSGKVGTAKTSAFTMGKSYSDKESAKRAQVSHVELAFASKCKALLVEADPFFQRLITLAIGAGQEISEVYVAGRPISGRLMWALTSAFYGYSPLKKLAFIKCPMERGCVRALAEFLRRQQEGALPAPALPTIAVSIPPALGGVTTNVSSLKFQGCNLGAEEACMLASAIQQGTTLREIWLDHNPIGSTGALSLAGVIHSIGRDSCSMTTFSLSYCGIDASCTEPLLRLLLQSSLEEVYLDGNTLGSQTMVHILEGLRKNEKLNKLGLANIGIRMHTTDSITATLENEKLSQSFAALCSALRDPTFASQLYSLDLRGNSIGGKNALLVLDLLKDLKALTLKKQRRPLLIPLTERIPTDTFKKLLQINKYMDVRAKRIEKLRIKAKKGQTQKKTSKKKAAVSPK